jgi:penicillin-binding protein 1A
LKKKPRTSVKRPHGTRNTKSKSKWLRRICLLVLLIPVGAAVFYAVLASFYDLNDLDVMPQRSAVYDMDGQLYSRIHGENRIKVPLSEVSKKFIDALLVREDARFYSHPGVDPIGVVRAIFRNIHKGTVKEGASTLTQQLARNSFPLGGRTLHRKILEAFVSMRIELACSKDEILQYYVNRIYFGSGYWGVETASQAYFGKPAAKLDLGESAMLVGLIRSPNRFSPFNNLKGAIRERNTVLDRMLAENKISKKEHDSAENATPRIAKKPPYIAQDNYIMDAVQRDLEVLLREQQLEEGGLKIYTTIDAPLQEKANKALNEHLLEVESRSGYPHPKKSDFSEAQRKAEEETPYLQGALLVMDNHSGAIRAMVGGRDFKDSKYNRAIPPAQRQVGSTFKPFVYYSGYRAGLLPGGLIADSKIERGELRTASNWSPSNSDGQFGGMLPASQGLIRSRNTMTVRVGDRAGIDAVRQTAEAAGIVDVPDNPAIFLGAFDASLQEMVVAYSVFPNGGVRKQPYLIERIDDQYGNVLYRAAHVQAQVLDPGDTWMVGTALIEVMSSGTAASARRLGCKKPAGGKTGTTNDYRDAWFIGYTTSLTCGVWVGLDHPRTIIPRGYGSTLALPVWVSVMNAARENRYPADGFKAPVALRKTEVCSVTNLLATTGCESAGTAYTMALPVTSIPTSTCTVHSGQIVRYGEEVHSREGGDSFPKRAFRSFRRFFGR